MPSRRPSPQYGKVEVFIWTPFSVPVTRNCFRPPIASAISSGIITPAPPPRAACRTALNRCESGIDTVDLGTQLDQLGLDPLVAAVHVLYPGDHRRLLGPHRGQHAGGSSAP